jgi:predicted PurR-regulated permease PerM
MLDRNGIICFVYDMTVSKIKSGNAQPVMISNKSILALFVIGIILTLSFIIRDTILLVISSYVLFAGLNPLVNRIQSFEFGDKIISRGFAITIVVFGFLAVFASLLILVIVPTIDEIQSISSDIGGTRLQLVERYNLDTRFGNERLEEIETRATEEVNKKLQDLTNNANEIINLGRNIFGTIISAVTLLALVLYQLGSPNKVSAFISSLFPSPLKSIKLIKESETKLGGWLQGQFILMFGVGLLNYIFFAIFGIPFALSLALLAGLFDIVPIIGPMIAFIPIFIVTLALGEPWQVVAVSIIYLIIQQVEGNLLVPKIMESSVGLDPIIVLISLIIGSTLLGITGAILSVPMAAIGMILYQDWMEGRKINHEELEESIAS